MSVVPVTGSSTGIGLATALHFGGLGDGVYAGVRNIATASELTRAIEAEKLPVHPITLDVDDQACVSRAVGEVIARTGRIDVLVNNAGIGGGGPVEEVPVDWVRRSLRDELPRRDPDDPGCATRDARAPERHDRQRQLDRRAARDRRTWPLFGRQARARSDQRGARSGSRRVRHPRGHRRARRRRHADLHQGEAVRRPCVAVRGTRAPAAALLSDADSRARTTRRELQRAMSRTSEAGADTVCWRSNLMLPPCARSACAAGRTLSRTTAADRRCSGERCA